MRTSNSGFFFRLILLVTALLLPSGLGAQEATAPDALQLYRNGQYQAAIDATLAEIASNPGSVNSYVVLGWSLIDLGRWQEARDWTAKGLELARFDYRLVSNMGHALFQLNQNTLALQYLQEYVQLQPQGSNIDQIYFLMGEIFMRFGEYNHADMAFTAGLYHNPRSALWWTRLGYARELSGSIEGSRQAYREALNRQPNLGEALKGIQRLDALQ